MMKTLSISPHGALIKHIPQRTCIACRKVAEKGELVRLVRTASGSIEVDGSGKKSGRGAYLCQSRECWRAGLKGSRLERALRSTLTEDNRQQLIRLGEELVLRVNRGRNE